MKSRHLISIRYYIWQPIFLCAYFFSGCNINDDIEPAYPTDTPCTSRTDDFPTTQTNDFPTTQCKDGMHTSMGRAAHSTHQHEATISQEECKRGCSVACNENTYKKGHPKRHPGGTKGKYPADAYCGICAQTDK
jgi:hypothetical protein